MITLHVKISEEGKLCQVSVRPEMKDPTKEEKRMGGVLAEAICTILDIHMLIEGNGTIMRAETEEQMEVAMKIAGFKNGKPPSPPET